MKTMIFEHNDRICFSMGPVMQCPTGTTNEFLLQNEETVEEKQKFACLSRSSSEAHRLQRQARRMNVVSTSTLKPNFVHLVAVPTKCVQY